MNKFLISDVDGVLTTGQFLYNSFGKQYKIFGAHDSDGIKLIRDLMDIQFITADSRGFEITKSRMNDLKCEVELVSENDRYNYIKNKYGLENVIYVGDGYYDALIIRDCFYGICPKNARKECKEVSKYITESNSAEGAFLDVCLHILENKLYV